MNMIITKILLKGNKERFGQTESCKKKDNNRNSFDNIE